MIAAQPEHRRRDIIRCIFQSKEIGRANKGIAGPALSAVAEVAPKP
jgi:hypothetical protein